MVETSVFLGDALRAGNIIEAPAMIEEATRSRALVKNSATGPQRTSASEEPGIPIECVYSRASRHRIPQ